MSAFANALHAKGMRLSSDINGCPSGFVGAYTCADYAASTVDEVISVKTYRGTAERQVASLVDFEAEVLKAVAVLGGKCATGPNLETPDAVLPAALAFPSKQRIPSRGITALKM